VEERAFDSTPRKSNCSPTLIRHSHICSKFETRVRSGLAISCSESEKRPQSQDFVQRDTNLRTFTIFGWTSQSRKISNPYDLIFDLRPADDEISAKEAKAIWNTIAESTLKGEDLAKFMKHLGDDE
jgi:hypothetical protein